MDADAERLRDALADALSGLHEMIGYAPDYFREKWELDVYINRATAALMETPGGLAAIRKYMLFPTECECMVCNPLVKAREKIGKVCPTTGRGFIGPMPLGWSDPYPYPGP